MNDVSLDDLESEVYQDSFADGMVDLFVGLGLAVVGITWLWFESIAGLAGVFGATIAWGLAPIRSRVVGRRTGYVRWTVPRLRWERNQLLLLLGLGSLALLLGVALALSVARGEPVNGEERTIVAGLPAALLAIGFIVLAATTGFKRLWAYVAVLLSSAAVTVLLDAGPGGALLAAGGAIVVVGIVLLSRFLQAHPVREST